MKHLRILRYVDEVARTGSIRKAADQLNVTASAVNRRIMDLEEELGAQLFERRPRGVRLTAAGEVFVHYLREQDGGVERMKSQIEDLRGLRRGTVRIACSQALALDFLPREIAAFRARHPMVGFGVSVLDHEQAMTALAEKVRAELALYEHPLFVFDARAATEGVEVIIRYSPPEPEVHTYVFLLRPREIESGQFPWIFQKQLYDCLHDFIVEMFTSNPQRQDA